MTRSIVAIDALQPPVELTFIMELDVYRANLQQMVQVLVKQILVHWEMDMSNVINWIFLKIVQSA